MHTDDVPEYGKTERHPCGNFKALPPLDEDLTLSFNNTSHRKHRLQLNGNERTMKARSIFCDQTLPLKHSEKSSPASQQPGFAVRKNELKENGEIIMLLP